MAENVPAIEDLEALSAEKDLTESIAKNLLEAKYAKKVVDSLGPGVSNQVLERGIDS